MKLLFSFLAVTQAQESGENSLYPYDADTWYEQSETCGDGTMQSPIDLEEYTSGERLEGELVFDYSNATYLEVSNMDEVLKWSVAEQEGENQCEECNPSANVMIWPPPGHGYVTQEYELISFQCRQGSEHTIEGVQYDGECQFLHQPIREEEQGGAGRRRLQGEEENENLLIVSILLDAETDNPNEALGTILDNLYDADYEPDEDDEDAEQGWEGDKQTIEDEFVVGQLLEGLEMTSYYSYVGSLTYPPCTENVQWVIFTDVMEVSGDQIAKIASVAGVEDNYRTPQDLGEREVGGTMDPPEEIEEIKEELKKSKVGLVIMMLIIALLVLTNIYSGMKLIAAQKAAKDPEQSNLVGGNKQNYA